MHTPKRSTRRFVGERSGQSGPDGANQLFLRSQHDEGPPLFDMRNNFVGNVVYDLPKTKLTGIPGGVANGWQMSGVLSLASGFPFSVSDAGNTAQRAQFFSQDGLRPNLIPGGNNNPILGGPNLYYDVTQFVPSTCTGSVVCKAGDPDYRVGHYGNLGYNTLTGPGYATIDFSLLKNIPVNETSRFQFRTEFFNLANHPNFFLPNAAPFLSNGTGSPPAASRRLVVRRDRSSSL